MIQKTFGNTCKFYRNKLGLSQEKFALKIEMDRTYYASVESGNRNVSIQNICKICTGLGISLSTFFKKLETISREEL